MLFNHFSRKEVKEIVRKVTKDYEAQIASLRARTNELIEENRSLSAKLSELEASKNSISEAILSSVDAGKRLEEKSAAYVENQMRAIRLIAAKSKKLADDLKKKYPDEADDACGELNEFFARLDELIAYDGKNDFAAESAETDIDLDSICRELGIEDGGAENERELVFFEDDEN